MTNDNRDYLPFYNIPASGFGFDSLTFENISRTLVMHGRWTFFSESKYWLDKKTKQPKSKTVTDSSRLCFAHTYGRCEITFDKETNNYEWVSEPAPGRGDNQNGSAPDQESAEHMAMEAISCGWLWEPIRSVVPLTNTPQALASEQISVTL